VTETRKQRRASSGNISRAATRRLASSPPSGWRQLPYSCRTCTKETLKTILTLIAAVGLIQTAAEEPAWSLEGKIISADSCGPDCHCIIGGPPEAAYANSSRWAKLTAANTVM
jgi:hypothetical protein